MSEVNNNYVGIEIDCMRNNTDEAKTDIITTVIKQTEIPVDFEPISRSNAEKIFYEIQDDKKHKREWVFYFNNKFYCIYCLCFSPLDENRFVKGIEYLKNCRVVDKMRNHGKELHHITAKNAYLKKIGLYEGGDSTRNALKCIIKIIIYIATHGSYCFTAKSTNRENMKN